MSVLTRATTSTTGRAFVAAAVLMTCLAATPAAASESGRAERLYTKGLAELHAGHTEAALALFEQAVVADPNDVHGLYYRALGYGHAGRYEDAVANLKVVVAADDPSIDRDRLELGYALYRLERYDEAVAELEIASRDGRSAGEATMLLGIVETRRGNHDAARTALARVENLDPSRALPARYYQGLAAWRAGDAETAIEQFTWVSTQGGDGPYAREAAAFLERIRDGGTKPYRLYAGLAFEYDSNVALAPGDDNIAENVYDISDESDGRAVITAGGQYLVYATPALHVSLGYDFLQSLHFDLERFDVQTHRAGGQADYAIGPVTLGVVAAAEHSLLDEESLVTGGTVLPWVRVDEGSLGRSEFYYRFRGRNYLLAPYSAERDSNNHAAGARQFFALGSPNRNLLAGYRFDADRADHDSGEEYNYMGHQFEAGVEWAFDDDLAAAAMYVYKLEDYDSQSKNRDDDEHQVITRVQKRVHEYVWVTGSYIYVRNQSDQKSFDYSRHITSLGVEVRY
ncbi:MAG: tetratricopeptide repeat protein [Candidatus Binatia bacterium]